MNSSELCRMVVQTGLVLLLQTSLVLLLGLGLGWAMRRRGPLAQSLVYRAALAAALIVVLLSPALVPGRRALWQIALPSAAPVPSAAPAVADNIPVPMSAPVSVPTLPRPSSQAAGTPLPVDVPPAATVMSPAHASKPPAAHDFVALIAGLWLLGTFALLAWLGLGQLSLMAIRRRSVAVDGEAAALLIQLCVARGLTAPRLLASPRAHSPFLAGLWRPTIFLPVSYAQDFDADALRAILAHELAHWGRRDTFWMLLTRLLCALFWPQPLLWMLTRRMEQAAEEACDALALAQGCSPRAYADCLLSLAERRTFAPLERAVGVGLVSFRSAVGRRIQAILTQKGKPMSALSPRLRLAVVFGAIAAVLIAACFVTSSMPARSSAQNIVGTWQWQNQGQQAGTVTFHPDGTVTDVEGNRHKEGRYRITGESLTLQQTDQPNRDGTSITTPPEPFHFQLHGNVLTLTDKSGHRMAATRLTDVATEQAPPSSAPVGPSTETDLLAGLTSVQGPGLIVTLRDSKTRIAGPPTSLPIPGAPNLIHDTDINQTINELKAAGAEAIAINNQRLVGMSPIRCKGPTIYINNIPQAAPFVIKAIGDSVTLETALNLPNGVADGLRRMDPAMISMRQSASLTLPAYTNLGQPKYAHPVRGASGAEARPALNLKALLQQRGAVNVARENAKWQLAELNRKAALLKQAKPPAVIPGIKIRRGSVIVDKPDVPIRQKQEYVRKVHAYSLKTVQYWNVIAERQQTTALIAALTNQLQKLDREIAALGANKGQH